MKSDLSAEYARYLVGECNLTMSTAWTYEEGLKRLERYLHKDATELTSEDIRRFLRESQYHPATKNSTLVAIKSFRRWAILEHLLEPNGIEQIRGPRQIREPKESLNPEEVNILLDIPRRPSEYRLIYFGLFAGTRISESVRIGKLEWEHPEKLRFLGKGRKTREVPAHPMLQEHRELILSKKLPTRHTLQHVARSITHYTGVHFTPHSLRRTFAVTLSEAGVSREIIGALLGHAALTVTESYAPVRWSEKVEAISRLHHPLMNLDAPSETTMEEEGATGKDATVG